MNARAPGELGLGERLPGGWQRAVVLEVGGQSPGEAGPRAVSAREAGALPAHGRRRHLGRSLLLLLLLKRGVVQGGQRQRGWGDRRLLLK